MNYHCDKCNDEIYIYFRGEDGYSYARPCECIKIRKSLERAEKSGLGNLLNLCTFDRFKAEKPFQKTMLKKAKENIKNNGWFAIFGKTGCGKTHICVAMCGELLKQGFEVRFMDWLSESRRLKASVNETSYDEAIDEFKNAEVLFIDDFFKSENRTAPSNADIKSPDTRYPIPDTRF